jgi:hypothetical protein
MTKPCFALVLFLLVGFCAFLAVPAEDVPETPYDESEAMPYEDTAQFSIIEETAAVTATITPSVTCRPALFFGSSDRQTGRDSNTPSRHSPSLALLHHSLRC